MHLPVRIVNRVFHWGTMNPADLGRSGRSHEGNCLSASLCPEAWQQIVKLGGSPLYQLTKSGAVFVDDNALLSDARFSEAKNEIYEDRIRNGFVKRADVFEVRSSDEEGRPRYQLCMTHEEALAELECLIDDDYARIAERECLLGTDLLLTQLGLSASHAIYGNEYALLSWIRSMADSGAGIDGVYTDSALMPELLLAPLFAIFPGKVPSWKASPTILGACDEELMLELPEITSFEVFR